MLTLIEVVLMALGAFYAGCLLWIVVLALCGAGDQ